MPWIKNASRNFWEELPKTYNNNVLYAPEVDGSLFPKNFTPFCMNGMIGFLEDAFRTQVSNTEWSKGYKLRSV